MPVNKGKKKKKEEKITEFLLSKDYKQVVVDGTMTAGDSNTVRMVIFTSNPKYTGKGIETIAKGEIELILGRDIAKEIIETLQKWLKGGKKK